MIFVITKRVHGWVESLLLAPVMLIDPSFDTVMSNLFYFGDVLTHTEFVVKGVETRILDTLRYLDDPEPEADGTLHLLDNGEHYTERAVFSNLLAASGKQKSSKDKPKKEWKQRSTDRPSKASAKATEALIESIADGIAQQQGAADAKEDIIRENKPLPVCYLQVFNTAGEWLEEKEIVMANPYINPLIFSLERLKAYCVSEGINPHQTSLTIDDYFLSHDVLSVDPEKSPPGTMEYFLACNREKQVTLGEHGITVRDPKPTITLDEWRNNKLQSRAIDEIKIRKVSEEEAKKVDIVKAPVKKEKEEEKIVHKHGALDDFPDLLPGKVKLYPIYLSKYKDLSSTRIGENFDVHGRFCEIRKDTNIMYELFVNDVYTVLLDTDEVLDHFGPFVAVRQHGFGVPRDPLIAYSQVFDGLKQAMGSKFFGTKGVYDIEAITKWFAASLEKEGILHWRQRIGDLSIIIRNQILTESQVRSDFLINQRDNITNLKIDQYCFANYITTKAAKDAASCIKEYIAMEWYHKLGMTVWAAASVAAFFLPVNPVVRFSLASLNLCSFIYKSRRLAYGKSVLYNMGTENLVIKSCRINIAAVCSQGVPLKEIAHDAWITPPPVGECKPKTLQPYGCVVVGGTFVVPRCCAHDLYNGLVIRFLFARTWDQSFVNGYVIYAKRGMKPFLMSFDKYYSFDDYVNHLPSRRRGPIADNEHSLIHLKMYISNLFVKREAYMGKTADAFKPRMIHCREDDYQALIGPYFYAISKWLADVFDIYAPCTYDNDLTATQLGVKAVECAGHGRLFEVDVSNWDGSMLKEFLLFEKWLIDNLPHQPPGWHLIRKYWTKVSGKSSLGVSFRCEWGRRSGDMWTSSFNSMQNIFITRYVFGDPTLRGVFKGDDNFVGSKTLFTVEQLVARYAALGLTAKLKEVTLDKLEYCSGRFYDLGTKWKWGVKPFRVLSKFGLNVNNHPIKLGPSLNRGTAISLLPIAAHVPIIGPLIMKLASETTTKPLFLDARAHEYQTSDFSIDEPTDVTYQNFSTTYGLSLNDILALEIKLTQLSLSSFPCVLESRELLVGVNIDNDNPSEHYDEHFTIEEPIVHHNRKLEPFDIMPFEGFVWPLLEEAAKLSLANLLVPHGILASTILSAGIWSIFESTIRAESFVTLFNGHTLFSLPRLISRLTGIGRSTPFQQLICDYVIPVVWHHEWNMRAERSLVAMGRYAPGYQITCIKKTNNMRKAVPAKSAKSVKSSEKNMTKSEKKEISLLGKAMRAAGSVGGELLGGPMGARLGEKAGGWLSRITGQGDYKIESNTLGGGGVPSFSPEKNGIRVCHKEFLTNITTSTAFDIRLALTINPGEKNTFPWLSEIAKNFEEYELNGCVFVYNPTSSTSLNSTNPAQGVVVMATHYNVLAPEFPDKLVMESYEYSCSSAPYTPLAHPIECKPAQNVLQRLFVRTEDTTIYDDPRFYDMGRFELATEGMQTAYTAGELWITYDITFYKPRIASTALYWKALFQAPTAAAPIQADTYFSGQLPITATNVGSLWQIALDMSKCPAGDYFISIYNDNSALAATTTTTPVATNITFYTDVYQSAASRINAPTTGESSTKAIVEGYFYVSSENNTKTLNTFPTRYASGTMLNMVVIVQKLSIRPKNDPLSLTNSLADMLLYEIKGRGILIHPDEDEKLGDPDAFVKYVKVDSRPVTKLFLTDHLGAQTKQVSVFGHITEPDELLKLCVDFELFSC